MLIKKFLRENEFLNIEHLVFNQGPKRVGPFSHAVKAGGFLFVTGQMPTLPNDPTKLIDGGISNQTHQVMKNLKTVLTASNSSLENVVFVRIYLVNFAGSSGNVGICPVTKRKSPAFTAWLNGPTRLGP